MDRRKSLDILQYTLVYVPLERRLWYILYMWTLLGVSPGIVTMKCYDTFGRTKTVFGRPICKFYDEEGL